MPSNISFLIIHFDVLVSFHNLTNGDITLTNLKAETTYKFYMKIYEFQIANFSLEINDMDEKHFNYVNIYEYAFNSYAYEEKENQTILFSRNENNLMKSFSYLLQREYDRYKQIKCI